MEKYTYEKDYDLAIHNMKNNKTEYLKLFELKNRVLAQIEELENECLNLNIDLIKLKIFKRNGEISYTNTKNFINNITTEIKKIYEHELLENYPDDLDEFYKSYFYMCIHFMYMAKLEKKELTLGNLIAFAKTTFRKANSTSVFEIMVDEISEENKNIIFSDFKYHYNKFYENYFKHYKPFFFEVLIKKSVFNYVELNIINNKSFYSNFFFSISNILNSTIIDIKNSNCDITYEDIFTVVLNYINKSGDKI